MNSAPPPPPAPVPPMPPGNSGRPAPVPGIATSALFLGILSLTCLGCLAGVPAIICGHTAQSRINQSAGTLGGAGVALAGLIMGYASLALTLVLVPLLAAIAVPNFVRARERAQGTRVLSDCRMVETALEAYQAEYGHWPGSDGDTDADAENATVMNALRGLDLQANPRQIVFFDGKPESFHGTELVDPWHRPYHFSFDRNGDGAVATKLVKAPAEIAIWSDGANGINEYGEGDDVASWKPLPTSRSR